MKDESAIGGHFLVPTDLPLIFLHIFPSRRRELHEAEAKLEFISLKIDTKYLTAPYCPFFPQHHVIRRWRKLTKETAM